MVSIDDHEKWGDDYLPLEEEDYIHAKDKLSSLRDWAEGMHPVTSGSHLPKWAKQELDEEDPEEHLEDEFLGFEGFNIPIKGRQH